MSEKDSEIRLRFALMPHTQAAAWNAYSRTKPAEGQVRTDVLAKVRRLAEVGNADLAERILLAEPALDSSFDALNALVLILQRQERLEEAEAIAGKAVAALRSSEAKLMANMANGFIMQRRWSDAIDAARRCTELDPHRSSGWINLTFALARQRRTDELRIELRNMDAKWPKWRDDVTLIEAFKEPLLQAIVAQTLN